MSNTALIGALVFVIGGTVVLMNRCEWFKWCDPLPAGLDNIENLIKNTFKGTKGNSPADMKKLADAIGSGSLTPQQYNSLPTIGTTQDSNYRSTRINTNPNAQKNAAKVISSGQLHPEDPQWARIRQGIPGGAAPNTRTNLALSLHGYKMSVF